MGSKRNVSMSATTDTVKKVVVDEPVVEETDGAAKTSEKKSTKVAKSRRGKRYVAARSIIDKTKPYTIAEAVELVKKTSYGKFDSSITVDATVKEIGDQGSVSFPHSTGKTLRIAIASDEVLFELESGNANFDVLLTTPAFMPKLAKYARLLGPKGLMPNPKNNTIVQDPEARKKELEKGKVSIKSERKAPLVHMIVGKTSFDSKQLVENIEALVTALDYRLKKLSISAAMGPGVKVKLTK
ncbi:MAG TPA: hypothetical protein PKJ26_02475 [Candidatus Woesebacteria bacterium]|nr:hypothetical protein [Candidatus Woesebacteria bacterium]HNS65342.1 hypothetical protein [Candidatus Woesebacteria bacterium]